MIEYEMFLFIIGLATGLACGVIMSIGVRPVV